MRRSALTFDKELDTLETLHILNPGHAVLLA
jgi:hypothetical protein